MKITRRHLLILTAALPLAAWAAPYTTPTLGTDIWRAEWHDAKRNRAVPLKIYYPKGDGPYPVIIFSHGLGGTRENYEYLGSYWAAHGYVSVHLQHIGSDDAVWRGGGMQAMARAANAKNAFARSADVHFAIDQLEALNKDATFPLHGKLDLQKIGMAGHSFGANTTLMVSGAKMAMAPSQVDPRIKCAVAMSSPTPLAQDYDEVYSGVKIPIYHLTGTKDESPLDRAGATAKDRRLPFEYTKSVDAYLTIFKDGDHMLFSGRLRGAAPVASDARNHELIQQSTLAFWDACLKDDAKAKAWLQNDYAGELGESGTFEQKIVTPKP
jgi:predicted dienelactone hydrolase